MVVLKAVSVQANGRLGEWGKILLPHSLPWVSCSLVTLQLIKTVMNMATTNSATMQEKSNCQDSSWTEKLCSQCFNKSRGSCQFFVSIS